MREYLFLCGCARSGTSVLQRVLAGHAEIALGMERYIRRFRQTGRLSPDLFEKTRFFDVREGDTFYQDLSRFDRTYGALAERYQDCRYVGDKIPLLYRGYDAIFEDFADARFIFISRNIWDVASSFKRRALNENDPTWGDGRGVSEAIREWNDAHRLTADAMRKYGDRIFVINYEKLFGEWCGLEAMFDFLGLSVTAGVKKVVNNERILGEKKRGARSEVLSMDEQLQILAGIDLPSYRQVNARWIEAPVERQPTRKRFPSLQGIAGAAAVPGHGPSENVSPAMRLRKYQKKDIRICDYRYAKVPGAEIVARGPLPDDLAEGRFVSYLGGAQTLGRFVQRPYPSLVGDATGWPTLNLGFGGGKPEFYLNAPGALDVINRGACAVIQVMSARGSPNSIIRAVRNENNFVLYHTKDESGATELFVDHAYRRLLREESSETVARCLQETRDAWVRDMSQLLNAIRVPKLLLWFSVREPRYIAETHDVGAFLGPYPQFVDEAMLNRLRPLADGLVECTSSRGMPSRLVDMVTGEPVPVFAGRQDPTLNTYYPSPEMHEDAAALLAPEICALLARNLQRSELSEEIAG